MKLAKFLLVLLGWLMLIESSKAGERLPCAAEPQGRDWHYRTKIPGYNGDVRGDRCWYDGPAMKPREELYWPALDPVPMSITEPMLPPWQQWESERWRGAAPGSEHKE